MWLPFYFPLPALLRNVNSPALEHQPVIVSLPDWRDGRPSMRKEMAVFLMFSTLITAPFDNCR